MMIVAEPHHLREETLASKILRNELCFSCFWSILQGDDRSALLGDDKVEIVDPRFWSVGGGLLGTA